MFGPKWTPPPYVCMYLKLTKGQTRMVGGPYLTHTPHFRISAVNGCIILLLLHVWHKQHSMKPLHSKSTGFKPFDTKLVHRVYCVKIIFIFTSCYTIRSTSKVIQTSLSQNQGRSQTFQNEGAARGDGWPGLKMATLHRPLYKLSFHLGISRGGGCWASDYGGLSPLSSLYPCSKLVNSPPFLHLLSYLSQAVLVASPNPSKSSQLQVVSLFDLFHWDHTNCWMYQPLIQTLFSGP